MELKVIAIARNGHTDKFGIPRQSREESPILTRIVFEPEYNVREALRGIEGYSHLWLIWGFSENEEAEKHATVRPPLLGGNERMGLWATRSPFRPNNLGLSSVRILAVNLEVPSIEVAGADLMDGTPIYDIKPYLSYADSHPDAQGGFTDNHQWKRLEVKIPDSLRSQYSIDDWRVIEEVLSLDPRPHYHEDSCREYGMPFAGKDIIFKVSDGVLTVEKIVKL